MHDYFKAPYRDYPKDLYYTPDHPPASFKDLAEAHPSLTVNDLSVTFWKITADWLLWGADFAATATADERQQIIKAILLVETNGSMAVFDRARDARALEAQRFWVGNMSGEALTEHCQRVLDETISEESEWSAYLLTLKRKRGPKAGQTGYLKADLALIPEVNKLRATERSDWAACLKLAKAGVVLGDGDNINLARRLYGVYRNKT